MKIGIITFQRAYSYGAKLQAYALSTYLCMLGHQAEIIDYSNIGWNKIPGIKLNSLKDFVKSLICYLNSFRKEKLRRKNLDDFFFKKTPHTLQHYNSETIKNTEKDFDIFIAGSDQIWCPRYNLGDMNFLLSFVKDNKKKFSYAASFGFSSIDSKYEETYKQCLNSFNKVLVRETEGARIVKQLTQRNAEVVLDPTFLLNIKQWSSIAHYPFKKKIKYILCFKILSVSPAYQKLIDHLSLLTGYHVIVIDTSYRYKPIKGELYSTAGPEEFLGLIKEAQLVVTNSFHATVFSIIFNKNFYTVLNENGLNSRMTDLATKLRLSHRMFDNKSELPTLTNLNIDYQEVNNRLDKEICKSKALLSEILN